MTTGQLSRSVSYVPGARVMVVAEGHIFEQENMFGLCTNVFLVEVKEMTLPSPVTVTRGDNHQYS